MVTRDTLNSPGTARLIATLFTLALLIAPTISTSAFADSSAIVVKDSSGTERAQGNFDKPGKIDFTVADASGAPAQSAEITLTNSATGEMISTQAVDGIATFEGVAPGNWVVASVTPGVTFTNITIGDAVITGVAGFGTVSATTIAVGAVAVGGATVGIVAATDSNNSDPVSPST